VRQTKGRGVYSQLLFEERETYDDVCHFQSNNDANLFEETMLCESLDRGIIHLYFALKLGFKFVSFLSLSRFSRSEQNTSVLISANSRILSLRGLVPIGPKPLVTGNKFTFDF